MLGVLYQFDTVDPNDHRIWPELTIESTPDAVWVSPSPPNDLSITIFNTAGVQGDEMFLVRDARGK